VSVSDGMLDMVFLRKVDNPMVAGIEVERIGP
jgi:hypothetical protein